MSEELKPRFDAMPYGTHRSFADKACERDDYNFRVEFPEGTPEEYEAEVIRLIEAAPDLLEALRESTEELEEYVDEISGLSCREAVRRAIKKSRAVIAKAEGQQ